MADEEQQVMSDSNAYETATDAEAAGATTTNYAAVEQKDEEQPSAPPDYNDGANVELQAMSASYADDSKAAGPLLAGKWVELDCDGKIINFQVKSVGDVRKDTTSPDVSIVGGGGPGDTLTERTKTIEEEQKEEIDGLVPDSTNAWLYVEDKDPDQEEEDAGCMECCSKCTDDATNKFIAAFVIFLQIAAYIAMTLFLVSSRNEDFESQQKSCYGQYCSAESSHCMTFGTGGLTSILLVGFLWADVVNTAFLIRRNWTWAIASTLVLAELFTAIICGFLVGVYSESDFDAIGGAVGILFVHDLDEKVYASMQVFRGQNCATFKKILAISLWIILSIAVALGVSCTYDDGSLFGNCRDTEFACANGDCIWEGFQCNGVEDCSDGSDEGTAAKCSYALHNQCPTNTTFQCVENGACIDSAKRCNGILDCPLGSDEGRGQNCSDVIAKKKCSDKTFNRTKSVSGSDFYEKWTGVFKCNNGQCINAAYACDGIQGDCVDGSDEYPNFYKGEEYPFLRKCPYDKLVSCDDDEVLCKISGTCISKQLQICNGINDCEDGADEKQCDYSCSSKVKKGTHFQCGGLIAQWNPTTTDTGNYTTFFAGTVDDATIAAATVNYDATTPANETAALFTGQTGACVPVQWRCDGTIDCPASVTTNNDEDLCLLYDCPAAQYQCKDTGVCIPKTSLCDGYDDCEDGSDEVISTCKVEGVTIGQDACKAAGYAYTCSGSSGICVYAFAMCDGYQDCPFNDDESADNCKAALASTTSTTFTVGGDGSVACGGEATKTGASAYSIKSVTFTAPSSGFVKISNCYEKNQGDADLAICPKDDVPAGCIFPMQDYSCSGCNQRTSILATTDGSGDGFYLLNIVADAEYVIMTQLYFAGTWAFMVECDASSFSGGPPGSLTCKDSASSANSFQTTFFQGFDTSFDFNQLNTGSSGSFPTGGSGSYPSTTYP